MVADWENTRTSEADKLPFILYLLYLRDSIINSISATEKGREYLEECYALSQTKADRVALKKKFGGS